MKLTKAQQKVWEQINSPDIANAEDGGWHPWWEVKKWNDGHISGKFLTTTLRALETAGLIKVTRDGTPGHSFDELIILKQEDGNDKE